MKLGCLFSGGKDSTYSLYKSLKDGQEISCLISLHPYNDESLLYHYPNNFLFKQISQAIEIPIIEGYCDNISKNHEIDTLFLTIKQAIKEYSIEGLVHGTISSKFQLDIFKNICNKFDLKLYSPLWNSDPYIYYNSLFNSQFEIMITRVAALGLDESWLGKTLDIKNFENLKEKSYKFKFNINFEGGEAETLVLNCPIYKKRIRVNKFKIYWDGIRGTFEILDVSLIQK